MLWLAKHRSTHNNLYLIIYTFFIDSPSGEITILHSVRTHYTQAWNTHTNAQVLYMHKWRDVRVSGLRLLDRLPERLGRGTGGHLPRRWTGISPATGLHSVFWSVGELEPVTLRFPTQLPIDWAKKKNIFTKDLLIKFICLKSTENLWKVLRNSASADSVWPYSESLCWLYDFSRLGCHSDALTFCPQIKNYRKMNFHVAEGYFCLSNPINSHELRLGWWALPLA